MEDPFDVDLGLHRWLDAEREEAYSDWLEWVVRQARRPAEVFRLFNLPCPSADVVKCQQFEAQRECCVSHGHVDQEGRLDLVIRYGHKAIIVVEVKKGDADDADTGKQAGYSRWLRKQGYYQRSYSVLLATKASEESYENFRFVSWASLCLQMRCLAARWAHEPCRLLPAAMLLAFVAAIEQNLLGFSSQLVHDVCTGHHVMFNAAVVDYLEQFLELLER